MADRKISKEPVVGFVVIQYKDRDETDIFARPLVQNWQDIPDNVVLDDKEKIIGVIPAPPGSYQVWGTSPEGKSKPLGFEYPGAYYPDWQEMLGSNSFEEEGQHD